MTTPDSWHGEADRLRRVSEPIIHQWNGCWWFWDETWANRYGPYRTSYMAYRALKRYGKSWL